MPGQKLAALVVKTSLKFFTSPNDNATVKLWKYQGDKRKLREK